MTTDEAGCSSVFPEVQFVRGLYDVSVELSKS